MKSDREPEPIFEVPCEAQEAGRRALLLAYHFPPGQAAGALRWQKFVEYGATRGWTFDVITLQPARPLSADPERLQSLPPGTRVFGVPNPPLAIERFENWAWRVLSIVRRRLASRRAGPGHEAPESTSSAAAPTSPGSIGRGELQFRWLELRSWWRAYQSLVELTRMGVWARRAARLGRAVSTPAHAVVISSSPPEMPHVGAARLAKDLGLPFVPDFRDPWSLKERLTEHLASPVAYRLAGVLEARVVRRAARIVMNTDAARDAMREIYPDRSEDIVAIPNGFDDEAIPHVERDSRRFVVAYAGAVYLDRNPETFFRAASRVVKELNLLPEEFSIEFMGHIGLDFDLDALSRAAGVSEFVHTRASGTRAEAAEFMAGASMLLNLPQDSHLAIPSKIYDYMTYQSYMLVLAEAESATANLLRDTRADVIDPRDEVAIARVLAQRVEEWQRGERPMPLAEDDRFSRTARAVVMFDHLGQVSGPASPVHGSGGEA